MRAELAAHGAGLEQLPELVMLSKRDLLPPEDVEAALVEWRERLGAGQVGDPAEGAQSDRGVDDGVLGVLAASAATREGLDELRQRILAELDAVAPAGAVPVGAAAREAEFEAEHRVYRPVGEGGYWVEQEDDGGFRILGRGVELLFERHDLKNEEALAYLEQRLGEMGVIAALTKAGFEPGNDVRVGEHEFELHI